MLAKNPKLSQASVGAIALFMMQLGIVASAILEMSGSRPAHLEHFLGNVAVAGALWMLVVVVDVVAFSTMRMTRLVLGPAFEIAAVVVGVSTGFGLFLDAVGTATATSALALTGQTAFNFVVTWAVISVVYLVRERVRFARGTGSYRDSVTRPLAAVAEKRDAQALPLA